MTRSLSFITTSLGILVLVFAAGCPSERQTGGTGTEEGTQAETPAHDGPITVKDAGLSTPESVLYDAQTDMYLVSNINGSPLDVDGNGFISRLKPDGTVSDLKWIDGEAEGVTLNAPKGLALLGDTLYVADIDTVRMFDRKSGSPKGEVALEGATFVNDLASADGGVWATDSGLTPAFKPSGSDAVYWIDGDTHAVKAVAKSEDLGHPNGLLVSGDKVWVVTFGTGAIYELGTDGKKVEEHKLPNGQLDGIVAVGDGTVLISSWGAKAVYRGQPGGPYEAVIENVESPADIGWDSKRHRVLIPLFNGNAVHIEAVD